MCGFIILICPTDYLSFRDWQILHLSNFACAGKGVVTQYATEFYRDTSRVRGRRRITKGKKHSCPETPRTSHSIILLLNLIQINANFAAPLWHSKWRLGNGYNLQGCLYWPTVSRLTIGWHSTTLFSPGDQVWSRQQILF